ncbi:MAG: hypothetical protein P4M01_11085 [Acidobacteriota bacterium]|nr:hypothetical protein [Acidobacteriota bacterium]
MSVCTTRSVRNLILAATFLLAPALFAADAPSSSLPLLPAAEIVSRMTAANQQRAALLHGYQGHRSYQLEYQGFPNHREAALEVVAHYAAPGSKQFDVVGESGSKMLQSKVLMKLLESEREAASGSARHNSDLTAGNYSFTLLGTRPSPYGGCYLLGVSPRREDKFLYRGEICVNAADFAVESINAEPARSPSFWIKKTHIEHRYQKIGEFWLPASNRTVTNVRLGGTATLKIEYTNYNVQASR